jgi:small nuclear ribonucleoprotein (snRNP)-like protein
VEDAEGNPILPGVLPAGTQESAKQAWLGIAKATGFEGEVKSFDLHFNLILRQEELDNQMSAHLRFLRPSYIRAKLSSGRSHLRGPEGDFLIDGKEVIRLVGREGQEDKQQIDRTSALARNFVALVDPTKLRILDLVELDAPPAGLPAEIESRDYWGHAEPNAQALGAGLKWISLRSPDFELENAGDASRTAVRSCLIGYEPNTMDVELAVIQRDVDGRPRRTVDRTAAGTLVVVMGRHELRTVDNVRVPRWIGIFDVVDAPTGKFRKRPGSELVLDSRQPGSFRAGLKPADFLPPTR